MAPGKVEKQWPGHKWADPNIGRYGPLPNPNPWKKAKHQNRPKSHDQSVNV